MSCAAAASSSRPSASNGVTIAVMTPPMALMLRRPFSLDRLERVWRLLGGRGRRGRRRGRGRGGRRRVRRGRRGARVLAGRRRSAGRWRRRRLTPCGCLLAGALGLLLVELGLLLLELLLGLLGRFLCLHGRLLRRLLGLVQKPHRTSSLARPEDRPRAYPLGPRNPRFDARRTRYTLAARGGVAR